MKIKLCAFYLFFILLASAFSAHAQGHYMGGSFNTNDYFIPPVSGWVFPVYYSYSSMNFYNDSGDKSDKIEVSQDPPITIELGQSVKTKSVIPMVIYFGKNKILGASWGIMVLPLINNPNANIALDFYSGQELAGSKNINLNSFGLGDMYLQPLWLTWDKNKFSTSFSYGFWIPTGKYTVNDPENVGLGYGSHDFRAVTRYRLRDNINVFAGGTLELNHEQEGTDFREAPHVTVDYGGSYTFTQGHEIGIFGFGTWQIGNDAGEKAILDKDRIFGLGIYGSYWFIPGKLGVLSRISTNFGTRNRFGGPSFQIGINYSLLKM